MEHSNFRGLEEEEQGDANPYFTDFYHGGHSHGSTHPVDLNFMMGSDVHGFNDNSNHLYNNNCDATHLHMDIHCNADDMHTHVSHDNNNHSHFLASGDNGSGMHNHGNANANANASKNNHSNNSSINNSNNNNSNNNNNNNNNNNIGVSNNNNGGNNNNVSVGGMDLCDLCGSISIVVNQQPPQEIRTAQSKSRTFSVIASIVSHLKSLKGIALWLKADLCYSNEGEEGENTLVPNGADILKDNVLVGVQWNGCAILRLAISETSAKHMHKEFCIRLTLLDDAGHKLSVHHTNRFYTYSHATVLQRHRDIALKSLSFPCGPAEGGWPMHIVGTPFQNAASLRILFTTVHGKVWANVTELYGENVAYFKLPPCPGVRPLCCDEVKAFVQVTPDGRNLTEPLLFTYFTNQTTGLLAMISGGMVAPAIGDANHKDVLGNPCLTVKEQQLPQQHLVLPSPSTHNNNINNNNSNYLGHLEKNNATVNDGNNNDGKHNGHNHGNSPNHNHNNNNNNNNNNCNNSAQNDNDNDNKHTASNGNTVHRRSNVLTLKTLTNADAGGDDDLKCDDDDDDAKRNAKTAKNVKAPVTRKRSPPSPAANRKK